MLTPRPIFISSRSLPGSPWCFSGGAQWGLWLGRFGSSVQAFSRRWRQHASASLAFVIWFVDRSWSDWRNTPTSGRPRLPELRPYSQLTPRWRGKDIASLSRKALTVGVVRSDTSSVLGKSSLIHGPSGSQLHYFSRLRRMACIYPWSLMNRLRAARHPFNIWISFPQLSNFMFRIADI